MVEKRNPTIAKLSGMALTSDLPLHIRQKLFRVGSALLLRIANRLRQQNLWFGPNFKPKRIETYTRCARVHRHEATCCVRIPFSVYPAIRARSISQTSVPCGRLPSLGRIAGPPRRVRPADCRDRTSNRRRWRRYRLISRNPRWRRHPSCAARIARTRVRDADEARPTSLAGRSGRRRPATGRRRPRTFAPRTFALAIEEDQVRPRTWRTEDGHGRRFCHCAASRRP